MAQAVVCFVVVVFACRTTGLHHVGLAVSMCATILDTRAVVLVVDDGRGLEMQDALELLTVA
jgi:hypothetical protein